MKANHERAILELEKAWAEPNGFLYRIRNGNFDLEGRSEFLATLDRLCPQKEKMMPRRLVSLLWYLPLFLEWQRDRILKAGGAIKEFDQFINDVQSRLEDILGVP